ncbi:hypothetical protein WDU94_010179 [Cyamophila willieti]
MIGEVKRERSQKPFWNRTTSHFPLEWKVRIGEWKVESCFLEQATGPVSSVNKLARTKSKASSETELPGSEECLCPVLEAAAPTKKVESAIVALEKTMGTTLKDKHIFLCSCYSIEDTVGTIPCDKLWHNHVEDKIEDNVALLGQSGLSDTWETVDKLSRSESQCTLFEEVASPVFSCFVDQILLKNNNALTSSLPVNKLRLNWLFNRAADNNQILEDAGVLIRGDNGSKGALDTLFIKCLRDTIKSRTKDDSLL